MRLQKIISIIAILGAPHAHADSVCMYVENGKWKSVPSIMEVPKSYRGEAKCFGSVKREEPKEEKVEGLAAPAEIQLEGDERRVTIPSSLGRIELRWARQSEKLFGRTPERALQDAITTVSRTLRKGGFPTTLFQNTNWQVVVMDENVPAAQIPQKLVTDCHPAWMTGPANIYVVAQRVATGCTGRKAGTREADAELAKVLLHEIGHVVEYHLLGGQQTPDRFRAEGFATWFAQYASDFSALIKRGELREENRKAAEVALSKDGDLQTFDGSFFDYAKASLLFTALADRKGAGGVVDLYEELSASGGGDLFNAMQKRHYWNGPRISKEIERVMK